MFRNKTLSTCKDELRGSSPAEKKGGGGGVGLKGGPCVTESLSNLKASKAQDMGRYAILVDMPL